MVSGLVTSPCDQLRIFSGDARLMRMASKSATGFAISNGLERNMFLRFLTLSGRWSVASFLCFAATESLSPAKRFLKSSKILMRCQRLRSARFSLGTVQCPHFHFSETLASELRLATQRLLRDQRVRPDGTRMNLVVHQVRQLQHVD